MGELPEMIDVSEEKNHSAIVPLVVAISSRALFDLSASHKVFESQGLDAYHRYQIRNEGNTLDKGVAFALVEKLLGINEKLQEAQEEPLDPLPVEVILLSRNSADTGLRIFNSIDDYKLKIKRAAFCGGDDPYRYISPFKCNLFLSTDSADVRQALKLGVAAATILPSKLSSSDKEQLKIAFDGDAVLFSDESEKIFQKQGLEAFADHERKTAKDPLAGGPFKPVLSALQNIQHSFKSVEPPIRTCLVTSRAAPAHERVVRTLRAWEIRIDESLFIGGHDKGEFLKALDADIFFDDQQDHCDSASKHVATGHVPHGIGNE